MNILDNLWLLRHPYDALFLDIIEGYTLKESKEYPNTIFYMKGDRVFIEYDNKTKYAYINYDLIWSVFSSQFSINHEETRELLRCMLETHLKLQGTTPILKRLNLKSRLETHLKLQGTTPNSVSPHFPTELETHINQYGITIKSPYK